MSEDNVTPLEAWSAIEAMRRTKGWELFMARYAKEGDEILTKLLDPELSDVGARYTKRDLYAHQLEALGRIGKVLNDFEIDFKNVKAAEQNPKHIGV